MAKKNNNLPAYTTVENLLNLINVLKKSNKSEDSIKALFGMGKSAYDNTKSSLKAFGIIESDSFEFTDFGRDIAYSGDDNKKDKLTEIVKDYEPYKLVFFSIADSQDEIIITEKEAIKNLWGKASMGSTDRNRDEGATLFMSIIDYIDFGKYIIGRGSGVTRLEWVFDIKDKISDWSQDNSNDMVLEVDDEELIENPIETESAEVETQDTNNTSESPADERIGRVNSRVNLPSITINVEMGDWPNEKIKTFFKYAYGNFEED